MGIYPYDLGSVKLPAGELKITLFHPCGLPAVPAVPTLETVGEFIERIESEPNVIEMGSVEISVVEDYSLEAYPEGFWYFVLNSSAADFPEVPELHFSLDEGNGDTFLFWGRVERTSVQWEEHVLGNGFVRTCTFSLLSVLKRLEDLSFQTLFEEVVNQRGVDDEPLTARPAITGIELGGDAKNDGVQYKYS
jgi:hypothetical protein